MIVVLSGPVAVGKSAFAGALSTRFEVTKVSTREFIRRRCGTSDDRGELQRAGERLDKETGGAWIVEAVRTVAEGAPAGCLTLVDSVRIPAQLRALREAFGCELLHVHLTASDQVLRGRYAGRTHATREFDTYDKVQASPTEAGVGDLAGIADVVADAGKSDPASLVAYAVAGRAGFVGRAPRDARLVDVLVGGQYGSEGKGNICSFLAREYGTLVRVGGPNAGHIVHDPYFKYRQLPSGTGTNPDATVLIAAGSTIQPDLILREIEGHRGRPGKVWIDPQAMVIEEDDLKLENGTLASIASTKQGVGAASARKITNRGEEVLFGSPVRLAKDVPELSRWIRDTRSALEEAYAAGGRVLVEGTQGTELSIHHGTYPFVTSRETSASGCLSDAGIAPSRVGRVYMVTRTYPIRVGGTSGPMGVETSMDAVAQAAGIPLDEVKATETGSVSNNLRRIAEFDWERFRRSADLNGATDVVLTFVDYLGIENRGSRTLEALNDKARAFIADMERVGGAPVSLVSTGATRDHVIDRRPARD